jgi:hypothetical protein
MPLRGLSPDDPDLRGNRTMTDAAPTSSNQLAAPGLFSKDEPLAAGFITLAEERLRHVFLLWPTTVERIFGE